MRRQRRRVKRLGSCCSYPHCQSAELPTPHSPFSIPLCQSPFCTPCHFGHFAIWNVNQSVKFHIEWRRLLATNEADRSEIHNWPPAGRQQHATHTHTLTHTHSDTQTHTHTHSHTPTRIDICTNFDSTHLPFNIAMTKNTTNKWKQANILLIEVIIVLVWFIQKSRSIWKKRETEREREKEN